jgi:hypothetical protein
LRAWRTPADPGSRKSEPEMTTLPSSRSRSTSSRRRASIWVCNTRRSSETISSLLVSSCTRDVNSSRATECGSGKAGMRPFSCATRITASSTERGTPRSAVSSARAQLYIHEHSALSTTGALLNHGARMTYKSPPSERVLRSPREPAVPQLRRRDQPRESAQTAVEACGGGWAYATRLACRAKQDRPAAAA